MVHDISVELGNIYRVLLLGIGLLCCIVDLYETTGSRIRATLFNKSGLVFAINGPAGSVGYKYRVLGLGSITLKTLWIHAVNSFVVFIDILTSCHEVRIMHYAYVLAFGCLYIAWTVIHYHTNIQDGRSPSNRYIYSAIDWSKGSEGKVREHSGTPPSTMKLPFHLPRARVRVIRTTIKEVG